MKSEIKNRWVKALKTNKFLEAPKGVLIQDSINEIVGNDIVQMQRFSPIGVLVELFRQDNDIKNTPEFWENCWCGETLEQIENWAGFSFSNPVHAQLFASIVQADTHFHQVHSVWIRKHCPVKPLMARLKKSNLKIVK